jgi:hypothetical protein
MGPYSHKMPRVPFYLVDLSSIVARELESSFQSRRPYGQEGPLENLEPTNGNPRRVENYLGKKIALDICLLLICRLI